MYLKVYYIIALYNIMLANCLNDSYYKEKSFVSTDLHLDLPAEIQTKASSS